MASKAWARALGRAVLLVLALTALNGEQGMAQTSTGMLRGVVRDADGQAVAAASVVATHVGTNHQRGILTSASGFFSMPGLQPGEYEVKFSSVGYAEQTQRVRVLVGQTLALDVRLQVEAVALEGIEVRAARVIETQTPEVATNVTVEQIANMPLNDRNFLSLATVAPGVRRDGGSITSGAQSANNINLFIDGVSFKNDMLVGGVAGQDASKGNPFPQNAVQEFRIITQQYKAEYQKATSAIITATTKSGTNEWHGDIFGFGQNRDMIEQDYFAKQRCETNQDANPPVPCAVEPKLDKYQFGGSLGGPIIRDRLFFFGSYEGNHQTRANTVVLGTQTTGMPDTLLARLRTHEGTRTSPFRSNLFFGKLTYTPLPGHRFEAIANIRDEYDIRSFGNQDSYDNAEHFFNDVDTYALKHQYTRDRLLNEATLSYQEYRWYPVPLNMDKVGIRYQGVMKIGGRSTMQDFTQKRLSLRNDLSYSRSGWFGDHVFKVGGNLDFVDYDVIRPLNGVPEFRFNNSNGWQFPYEAAAGFGDPDVSASNTQFGLFAQDDWRVNDHLTLNLGVRWDVETDMVNNDWVTPDSIRTEVLAFRATLPCDGSAPHRDQLCEAERYFTDGDDRPPFYGAIQPRLGFSYDVFGDAKTTVFGGWGIYYDRNRYGNAMSERANLAWRTYTFRFSTNGLPVGGNPTVIWDPSYFSREGLELALQSATAPKPELFLVENEVTPPKSHQYSLGIRQAVGPLLVTASYTGVDGYNTFTWIRANRNANNSCCAQLPHFSNVFVSSDDARNWYDAYYLKVEKLYTEDSRWGFQLAYTYATAEEEASAADVFSALNVLHVDAFERYPTSTDERHRVTAQAMVGLPYGVRLSGVLDLGSGVPYNATIGFGPGTNNCTFGNQDCLGGNDWPVGKSRNWFRPDGESFLGVGNWAYRNVDFRIEKSFPTLQGQRVSVIAEVFNAFNFDNFNAYDLTYGTFQSDGSITPNLTFGEVRNVINNPQLPGTARRFQLGMRYEF